MSYKYCFVPLRGYFFQGVQPFVIITVLMCFFFYELLIRFVVYHKWKMAQALGLWILMPQ